MCTRKGTPGSDMEAACETKTPTLEPSSATQVQRRSLNVSGHCVGGK